MRTTIRDNYDPELNDYHDEIVIDEVRGKVWLFDCDGVYLELSSVEIVNERGQSPYKAGSQKWITDEVEDLEQAIEDLKNSTDVVDVVGTHAELESYDTSKLGDRDIIKVLQDETEDGATTYYRWNKAEQQFDPVGKVGPYYTTTEVDSLIEAEAAIREETDDNIRRQIESEIIAREEGDKSIRADLEAETAERKEEDGKLGGRIDSVESSLNTEISNRQAEDKKLSDQISGLDTKLNGEIDDRKQDTIETNQRIDTEVGDLQRADDALSERITAEETARQEADATLAGSIASLDSAMEQGFGAVNDALASEASARQAEDEKLNGLITTETSERKAADTTLQTNIDKVAGDLSAETTARKEADSQLESKITTESSKLSGLISAETTAREQADTDLQQGIDDANSAISAETEARTQADTELEGKITSESSKLSGLISTETSERKAADNTLQGNIDAANTAISQETQARTEADTTLQANIDNERKAREDAQLALQTQIGAKASKEELQNSITQVNEAIQTEADNRQQAIEGLDNKFSNLTSGYEEQFANLGDQISKEQQARVAADAGLQSQIDAIVNRANVADIVGTHAQLEQYDTSTLGNGNIIKVLQDETVEDATTYYRWDAEAGEFKLIGREGPFYTKGEADMRFVPLTRMINGKDLSKDISLTAKDVGALPDTTVIPTVGNGTLTIKKDGEVVGTFSANATAAKEINIVETDPIFLASAAAQIQDTDIDNWNNKSDFDGNYNSLSNKPIIGESTLTIQKEGEIIGLFGANSTANKTVNIVETDPIFAASPAAKITDEQMQKWNEGGDLKIPEEVVTSWDSLNHLAGSVTLSLKVQNTKTGATDHVSESLLNASTARAGVMTAAQVTKLNQAASDIESLNAQTAELSERIGIVNQQTVSELTDLIGTKQDRLTAGDNITISGNTISATSTKLIVTNVDPGEGSPLEPNTILGVY